MKRITTLAVVFLFIASCQPQPVLQATDIPVATQTPIQATPSDTPQPTPTQLPSPTATPVTLPFEMPKSFAAFNEQFPLAVIAETDGYLLHCAFNSGDIIYESTTTDTNGTEFRSWVKCYFHAADGSIQYINFPFEVVDLSNPTRFLTLANETESPGYENPRPCTDPAQCGFTAQAMTQLIPRHLQVYSGTDQPHVFIIGLGFGYNFSDLDLSQKFMRPIIEKLTTADAIERFASTGDASLLPTIGTVDHFLPAYDYLFDMPQ